MLAVLFYKMRIKSFFLEHNRKIINISWGRKLFPSQLNNYLSRETRWQDATRKDSNIRNHAKLTSSSPMMAGRVKSAWRIFMGPTGTTVRQQLSWLGSRDVEQHWEQKDVGGNGAHMSLWDSTKEGRCFGKRPGDLVISLCVCCGAERKKHSGNKQVLFWVW